ncbi:MAG: phosphotransferase family protein [Proteobacteria bacterium]|nr:phosphotransferase family protein [Pseudomonadota bacterium]
MSAALDPAEALCLVPGWDATDCLIEELKGGLTNRVYKIGRGGEAYVLRLDDEKTQVFGLHRPRELGILRAASAAGLAPDIIYADAARGILLSRYIDGRVWTTGDLARRENIEALAEVLRRIHALPLSGERFDPVAVAGGYLGKLESRPELYAFGERCKAIVESAGEITVCCCCHNDVVAANVVATPGLVLLDWEYACDNDPMFDLASLIVYHELDAATANVLLNAYAGGEASELRERLAVQVRVYGAILWLWLATRQMLGANPSQARRLEKLRRKLPD